MKTIVFGKMRLGAVTCLGLFLGLWGSSAEFQPLESYPRERVHLFLLAGQSNMAGRGELEQEDKKVHPRVFALARDGTWVPAVDPIHYDKPIAGVGLGKSFALSLVERDESIVVGLIPAACGGSPISTWEPGAYFEQTDSRPYDDALERTRRAARDGVLKGILWHQGEADSRPGRAAAYEEKLRNLIHRFRVEFGDEGLPFMIGQLGRFEDAPWNALFEKVDHAHQAIAAEMDRVAFVASDGLSAKADNVHFNAESMRAFGRRYAEAYLELAAGEAAGVRD